jgi:hypothetical protein
MATPTIPNGEEYFFNILYEGNGAGQRVGKFVPFTDNGTIANSVIFNDADNAYLSRTNDAGDRDTFTISVWVKRCTLGAVQHIFDTYDGSSSNDGYIRFNSDNTISTRIGTPSNHLYTTNRTFEDTSKWYHIMLSVNTNDSTAADRVKLYVDGDRITSFSTQTNAGSADDTQFNYSSATFRIGSTTSGSYDFDGYLAEFNQVDGSALTPDTFGLTDTSTGRWIPKTLSGITYGTNGFRLKFQDSSALGDDTSGNTNDFTVSNITSSDQTTDSPTSNYSAFTATGSTGTISLADGGLKPTFSSSAGDASGSAVPSTFRIPVGKWYFEYYMAGTNSELINWAVAKTNTSFSGRLFTLSGFKTYYPYVRSFYEGSSELITDTDMPLGQDDTTVGFYIERKTDGTVNMWAGDDEASTGTFAFQSSMNPATGANAVGNSFSPDDELRLYIGNEGNGNYSGGVRGTFNFGQLKVSPIDSGTSLTDYTSTAGGYFRFQPTTGFKALQQDNLPETAKGITGMAWIKGRDTTYNHLLIDSSRGGDKQLQPNLNNGELTQPDMIQKFLAGGYSVEDFANLNTSGQSYVGWNWVGNGGTSTSITTGTIDTVVQANTTAGFSIVKYTGIGSAGSAYHGLSQAPDVILIKDRDNNSTNWRMYHKSLGGITKYILLNSNAAVATASMWGTPTSDAFIVGGSGYEVNESSTDYVAYCWSEIVGYSKFSSYSGTGNVDGTFVYLGFKPALIIIKCTSNGSTDWVMYDNKRSPFNDTSTSSTTLYPNLSSADASAGGLDFLSNGFKLKSTNGYNNGSSRTYIYMAFAEHPFVGDGTNPVTAR